MFRLPWFIYYLIVINLIGFLLMYIDKRRAIRHRWRIPEKYLFLSAILGGSIGAILGMQLCRHKTKHMTFVVGMPVIFLVEIALALGLFYFVQRPVT